MLLIFHRRQREQHNQKAMTYGDMTAYRNHSIGKDPMDPKHLEYQTTSLHRHKLISGHHTYNGRQPLPMPPSHDPRSPTLPRAGGVQPPTMPGAGAARPPILPGAGPYKPTNIPGVEGSDNLPLPPPPYPVPDVDASGYGRSDNMGQYPVSNTSSGSSNIYEIPN